MRKNIALSLTNLRPLTREDMENLGPQLQRTEVSAARIRDSHHRVARLAASGIRNIEIAARTGYTQTRVSQLLGSPAMIDLIARYRAKVDAAFVEDIKEDYSLARDSWRIAARLRLDALEAAEIGEAEIPLKELHAIAMDGEDRFGTSKKSTSININADFAAELERALRRSNETAKVVEVEATPEGLRRRI